MDPMHIEVPLGVEQILLTFNRDEVTELHRRIDALQAQNADLLEQIVELKTDRGQMEMRQTQLALDLETVREILKRLIPPAPEAVLAKSESGVLAFCNERSPGQYTRAVKKTLHIKNIITLREETDWSAFPESGYSVKPDRLLSKQGNWQSGDRQLLRRYTKCELIASANGTWYYLGTYQVTGREALNAESLQALPPKTQHALIAQSGHKKHYDQLRALFNSGELLATKISFKRAGHNEKLANCLSDIAQTQGGNPSAEDGSDTSSDSG